MSSHRVRAYEYVNHPYERVVDVLRVDAIGVFQRATSSATARARAIASTMRASIGPLELGADVIVKVLGIEEDEEGPLGPRTRLRIHWHAARRAELFPTMEATLDLYALGPGETQLDFQGEYQPPLGAVGAAIDAVIGHRIAEAAIHRFVAEIAERLRVDVTDAA